jgi:hypothetical protein
MYTYILNTIQSLAESIGLLKKSDENDESIEKENDLTKEIDGPTEKVIDVPIEKVIDVPYENKQIYRTFRVKAPYSGPPQIMLSHNEELVKVHENGQYISMYVTNFEDYGTDDDDEKIKIIYNIVVEH